MKIGAISILTLFLALPMVWAQRESTSDPNSEHSAQSSDPTPSNTDEKARDHRWHLQLGTLTVGAGYERGPLFYPYAPFYPVYPAAIWAPYAFPVWGFYSLNPTPDLVYSETKGEVRLTGAPKTAKIYLDGAYAGTADQLKHMWLDPGAYDLAVSAPGRATFRERLYILSGKVLKIVADQAPNSLER